MSEGLWLQSEAAAYLRVTPRYLRKSSCPKVLLPSTRPGGKPLVRYDRHAVELWKEGRHLKLQRAG